MNNNETKLRCVNDRYSNTHQPFDSVEDFQAMCEAVHGEPVPMYEDGGDYYHADTGVRVLTPVAS